METAVDELEELRRIDLERIKAAMREGKRLSARDQRTFDEWAAGEEARKREAAGETGKDAGSVLQLSGPADARFCFPTARGAGRAYGYSERQVKNWKRDGRAKGMPCPLEEPARMVQWFAAVYAPREAPERLREAVRRLLTEGPPPDPEEEKGAERGAEEPEGGKKQEGTVRLVSAEDLEGAEVGFEGTLRRAREREALWDLKGKAAIEAGRPQAEIDAIETRWERAAGRVRELEKAAPAILAAQGKYVEAREVRRALVALAKNIQAGLVAELRRREGRLRGSAGPGEFAAVLEEAVAAGLRGLVESEFAEPLELAG